MAVIFPSFAVLDSDGDSLPHDLDVRYSVAVQMGQKVCAVVLVFCKQFLSFEPQVQLVVIALANGSMAMITMAWDIDEVCSIDFMVWWLRMMYTFVTWTCVCALLAWVSSKNMVPYDMHIYGGVVIFFLYARAPADTRS